jgi:hypothetical protein
MLADHPKMVNLREGGVVEAINGLFDPGNLDATVAALVESAGSGAATGAYESARRRLAKAEARLRRFQEAIGAGVDPAAVVDAMNQAQAERASAKAELDRTPAGGGIGNAEVYAMIDSLGDVGGARGGEASEAGSPIPAIGFGVALRTKTHASRWRRD